MPPKRKTGVQNVDIGGAYKLDRQDPDSEHNAVQDTTDLVASHSDMLEQDEDIAAELEALAMACDADNAENIAGEDGEAPVHEDHTIVQAATGDKEDVNVELRALAEAAKTAGAGDPSSAAASHEPAPAACQKAVLSGDGDKTDAEDVDQALAALENIVEAGQDLEDNAPATAYPHSQTSAGKHATLSEPEVISTTSAGHSAADKEASEAAAATLSSSSPPGKPIAASASSGNPPIKKSQLSVSVQKKLSVPAVSAKASDPQSKHTKGSSDKVNGQVTPAAVSSESASQSPAAMSPAITGTGEAIAGRQTDSAPAITAPATTTPALAKKGLTMTVNVPAKPVSKAYVKPAAVKLTSGDNATKSAASADATHSKAGKASSSTAAAAPKAPRAKNAYMFFLADKRTAVKADNPGASIGDVAKAVGEMWKGLSEEDKKPYQIMADADKERVAKLKADMPPVPKHIKAAATKEAKAAAKETKAAKLPRAKTAYLLFCDDKRGEVKVANPEAGFAELAKLLAAAWKECDAATKARYQEQSQVAKMELQATAAAATLAGVKQQQSVKSMKATAAKACADAQHSAGTASAAHKSDASERVDVHSDAVMAAEDNTNNELQSSESAEGSVAVPEQQAVRVSEDADTDDEADREAADFDKYPAETIIGHTFNNKYMVKRKGLDFTEYGLVDARAVKRQRLGGDDSAAKLPVSVEMMEEYESFCKAFRRSVHEHHDQGSLDLDEIGQGSPLEMCYYLGKLQEDNYLLSKAPKKKGEVDVMIKVPMLGLSMVTQRIVNTERQLRCEAELAEAAKAEEVERLKGELTVLQMVAQAAKKQQTVAVMDEE